MSKDKNRKRPAKPRPSAKSSYYCVFVSHSSQDLWIANVMADQIRALGGNVWLDEKDLEGGNIIVEDIIAGIEVCQEAVVLISPTSTKSQWVAFEIGAVRGQRKRITPILIHVRPEAMAPMKDVKAIDINKFDRFLVELKRRIRQYRAGSRKSR